MQGISTGIFYSTIHIVYFLGKRPRVHSRSNIRDVVWVVRSITSIMNTKKSVKKRVPKTMLVDDRLIAL